MKRSTAQGGHIRRKGLQISALEGKTRTDVMSTLSTQLSWLDNPIIEASTRETTFPIEQLLNGQLSLYFILPPDRAENYAPLVRAWITAIALRVFRAGESSTRSINFYFDEASLLGADLPVLETILTKGRSYGMGTVSYWQSVAQLATVYPEQQAMTYRDNMSVEQFMGVNSISTATDISKWVGQTTIQTQSEQVSSGNTWQSSQGQDSTSFSENNSVTTQVTGRALIQAEELLQLGNEATIILKPRCPPMVIQGIRDFRVKDRLLVEHLDIGDRIKAFNALPAKWKRLKRWVIRLLMPVALCLIICSLWLKHLETVPPQQRQNEQFMTWATQHAVSFSGRLQTVLQNEWNDLQNLMKGTQ